jgi:hypothetical protein
MKIEFVIIFDCGHIMRSLEHTSDVFPRGTTAAVEIVAANNLIRTAEAGCIECRTHRPVAWNAAGDMLRAAALGSPKPAQS